MAPAAKVQHLGALENQHEAESKDGVDTAKGHSLGQSLDERGGHGGHQERIKQWHQYIDSTRSAKISSMDPRFNFRVAVVSPSS